MMGFREALGAVIEHGRLSVCALSQRGFMAIRAERTGSQKQITYVASRAGDTGHAVLVWTVMHALHNEPLERPG